MALVVLSISIPPLVRVFRVVSQGSVDLTLQEVAISYADSMLQEIVSKEFEDPDGSAGSFGTEESSRAEYDDVDDFDGLSNTPPQRLDGTPLDDYGGYSRRVIVNNVTAANPDATSPETDGSTSLKRITVYVRWTAGEGGELSLSTLRGKVSG